MLSKNQLKLIISLQQKKYRNKHGLFIAEGVKVIDELLKSSLELYELYYTKDYDIDFGDKSALLISEQQLRKISSLKTPNKVLGVFRIPIAQKVQFNKFTLVLDDINDPGNLGTIIRLCDWFGVEQLICSKETVDCYNTKVVQATMGSLVRISIVYTEIELFLKETKLPVYGAVMNGENVHESKLQEKAILIMGNESNGISSNIEKLLSNKITIPRFGEQQKTESLNVATATAILLNEFKRT